MILITRMKGISKVQADRKFAIVRSYKYPVQGVDQLIALSPSWELFKMYKEWESRGDWYSETFDTLYAPRFISEIAHNYKAITAIKSLKDASRGKRIALACYCPEEALCHRWIVGSVLKGLGLEVEFAADSRPRMDWYERWVAECKEMLEQAGVKTG